MAIDRRPISEDDFARLVRQAIASLPPAYARLLDDVAVVVENEPSRQVLQELDMDEEDDLFGLYQGVALNEESFFRPGGQAPAHISLYRGPILRYCETEEEVVQEVCDTLVHELGHHVGLDDDEMPY
jgi:predicted Zn-dependent protease with MMP-like domain